MSRENKTLVLAVGRECHKIVPEVDVLKRLAFVSMNWFRGHELIAVDVGRFLVGNARLNWPCREAGGILVAVAGFSSSHVE